MSRLKRIVAELGGTVLAGGARALIAGPGHSPSDRSVCLSETEDGRILIKCFSPRDDWRAIRRMLIVRRLLDDQEAQTRAPAPQRADIIAAQPDVEDRIRRAQRIWEEAAPIASTVAERYLNLRAIARFSWESDALRFHPRMTSVEDGLRRPALLAALRDRGGKFQGLQVTLLSRYGAAKAALATPRRVIGKLIGGCVRLEAAEDCLLIAEGVETALSAAAKFCLPAWAALSAENLARFEPPPNLKRLVVAADNDAAGRMAFGRLRRRLDATVAVKAAPPPDPYNDWNDFARAFERVGKPRG